MFIKRIILRTAGASLAAIVCLAVQPLAAQTSSESKAIEELKREVAELQKEVSSLKQHGGPAPAAIVEGKTKTVVSMTEKVTSRNWFRIWAARNGNCLQRSRNWSSSVMHVSDTNTAGADFQVMIQLIQTIGMSANVNVIVCAWDCAARCLTIGFLECDWKPAPARARQT